MKVEGDSDKYKTYSSAGLDQDADSVWVTIMHICNNTYIHECTLLQICIIVSYHVLFNKCNRYSLCITH